jgi:outer membrane protein assembly factor BamB
MQPTTIAGSYEPSRRWFSRWTKRAGISLAIWISSTLASEALAQWHTLHYDYQRSGHTAEIVEGPYERKWWRDFHHEMIATRCEAIVADGKVFVGTFAGNLYALDIADGESVWRFEADGPIGASPCYHHGRLFFGSDDAFDRGTLYCLQAETGALIWKYASGAGIWASPACDGQNVLVGDRSGVLHAVRTKDGSLAWKFQTDYMILKPVSLTPDNQRIVLGSEDMHVYPVVAYIRRRWRRIYANCSGELCCFQFWECCAQTSPLVRSRRFVPEAKKHSKFLGKHA